MKLIRAGACGSRDASRAAAGRHAARRFLVDPGLRRKLFRRRIAILELAVNGEVRQKSTTANMIFDVPTLIRYVSEFLTLLPGDVISTGAPAGVGLRMKPEPRHPKPGDVVELGIDGLGRSRQRILAFETREAHAAGLTAHS